jgi:putative transposase
MPLIDLIGRLTIDVDKLNKKKIGCSHMSCFELSKLPKAQKLSLARVCIRDNPDTNKTQLSRILKINWSTLYVPQIKDDSDKVLAFNIIELLKSNPFYGYRRVAIYFKWSDGKARRLMRKYSIFPTYKKPRFLVKKDDLGNEPSKLQNHLKPLVMSGNLCMPNIAWSTDFTYLTYRSNFLYLATVIDTYTKEIVGYSISHRHTAGLIQKAMRNAIAKHKAPRIHHSDQGSEYQSYQYQDYLKEHNIQISMSKKSSPWEKWVSREFLREVQARIRQPKQLQLRDRSY